MKNTKLQALLQALVDEANELKGIKDSKSPEEWWKLIDWKTDEMKVVFESLSDETKKQIKDAGLCPDCTDTKTEEIIDEFDLEQDTWLKENGEADAVLSYGQKREHPDSDYAYIEPGCEKEDGKTAQRCRHLLIHDPAHVRAALAALGGARSGKVPPYAEKAKPKVCAAAKKFKIESTVCGKEKDEEKPKVEPKKDALNPLEVLKRAESVLKSV